ncbi:MAG: hypothetical protein Q4A54_12885 [Parabacteroides sp.]|nr:hypothetical protein [Parabacteroides sp.]
MMKRFIYLFAKFLGAVILIAVMLVLVTSGSLIYDFKAPEPFSGESIFNPYRNYNSEIGWKRAVFHVHTRVEGPLNECEMWPDQVHESLRKFNYDIVTFSNHNELTKHPFDSTLQVNVYEHGYNLFKYHKLVFGCEEVNYFDHLLPFIASQKQFQIDLLSKDADIIQINHPLRTHLITSDQLQKLGGYQLMELDSGHSTENEYWDDALSAGHYSFGLANDDLHYPDRSHCIAVRCNFICSPSGRYEDIKHTLLDGAYYSMRIPDYGKGDWNLKYEKNRQLPSISNIGLKDSTIYIALSATADSIKFIGQNHSTLALVCNTDSSSYIMKKEDPYARIIAYFPEGEAIYSNPFARYDELTADSPFRENTHNINYLLTILFNLSLIMLLVAIITLFYKLLKFGK